MRALPPEIWGWLRDRGCARPRSIVRLAGGSALVGLGAIVFEKGDNAEAIRLWKAVEARNPGLVLSRTNLAMAQWWSGDRDGARAMLREVMELSPAFRPAADLLRQLSR